MEDLDSTNGTYVNRQPIAKRPLKNGDVIVIGKHELRYTNESNSASDDEKTVLIRHQSGFNTSPSPSLNEPIDMPASIETDWNAAKPQILNEKDTGNHLSLQKPSVKIDKFGAEIIQINSV